MLSHPHNHQLQQPYASSIPLQHNSNQQPIVYYVIRRTGEVVAFNSNKIITAVTKVYISVHGTNYVHSSSLREHVGKLAATVMQTIQQRHPTGGSIHIEEIQDNVERILMSNGEHDIARAYILYREQHKQHRLADVAIIADKVVVDNPAAPHSPILAQLAAALPHTSADLILAQVLPKYAMPYHGSQAIHRG
jgi:hypothetical protein